MISATDDGSYSRKATAHSKKKVLMQLVSRAAPYNWGEGWVAALDHISPNIPLCLAAIRPEPITLHPFNSGGCSGMSVTIRRWLLSMSPMQTQVKEVTLPQVNPRHNAF